MPRKIVPISSEHPYHITARCINREWFNLPLETVWSIMEDYLFIVHHGFQIKVHSFVLMGNHFHLLVSSPQGNLSSAMNYFMRETSREISRLSGRINQTYGGRYHRSLITNYHHFVNVYKYVYQNPVRAKFKGRVEEYVHSTLAGILGVRRLIIPLEQDSILFNPSLDEACLAWLNRLPHEDDVEALRKALKRPCFKLTKNRKSNRPSHLENQLL